MVLHLKIVILQFCYYRHKEIFRYFLCIITFANKKLQAAPMQRHPSLKDNWTEIFRSPYKRTRMIAGTLIMLVIIFMMPLFFNHIEKRKGVILDDWVLSQIPPHNMSVLIFAIIWGMVLFILIRAIHNPSIYITYCWTLILVCIARYISITLVPLDPPPGLMNLTDPFTGVFYGNVTITKDLFFSGHTSTMFLIFLCLERKTDKLIALLAVVIVAGLLLVQHVHYTIDVLVAPFVVYSCYLTTRHILYSYKIKVPEE